MANPQEIIWPGQVGAYIYQVYDIDAPMKEQPGNYIFAAPTPQRRWRAIYVGQTTNLDDRLENHEKRACAISHGATHIHAHLNLNKTNRLAEQRDLIRHHGPPCNDQ
jgi:hypothetical protein